VNNSISVKIKLEEPIYIDENTVEINWSVGKCKQPNPLMLKFNGQVWQTENN